MYWSFFQTSVPPAAFSGLSGLAEAVIFSGALLVVGATAVRLARVVGALELKVDRMSAKLFGDPESRFNDGLIASLHESQADRRELWLNVRAVVDGLERLEKRLDAVQTGCLAMHPRLRDDE